MAYTNSPMVVYTKLSPNHSGQRTHSIDRITPHCVVGQLSVESLGEVFAPVSRQASSNYGIGADGRVAMYVEEKNRSWCSSSNANDQRAITIECASDATEPYTFRDVVYDALVKLCIDICQRNGKNKLIWLADKEKTLAYEPKPGEMILTVHRWFDKMKSCPGDWMYARMGDLAEKVTAALGSTDKSGSNADTASTPTDTEKLIWDFLSDKIGNAYGVAGLMGNLYAESNLQPTNLQNSYEKSLRMTDDQYTAAVDDGTYTNFVKDSAGYGLAQWTYWSRKKALFDHAKASGKSIGDLVMQLDFLWMELSGDYKSLLDALKKAENVSDASTAVLAQYERPADQSEAVQSKRAAYGQMYYGKYAAKDTAKVLYRVRKTWKDAKSQKGAYKVLENAKKCADSNPGYNVYDATGKAIYTSKSDTPEPAIAVPFLVQVSTPTLNIRKGPGTDYDRTGHFTGVGVFTIVEVKFGEGSTAGWGRLKSGAGWISLDLCTKL